MARNDDLREQLRALEGFGELSISATTDDKGQLGKVGGLWEKLGGEALELGRRGLLRLVAVAADQKDVPARTWRWTRRLFG